MLIRRCAWHPQYRGYRLVYGVTSLRGPEVRFTDGICRRCAVRLQGDLGIRPPALSPPPRPRMAGRAWAHARLIPPAGLAVLALAGVVYAARAIHLAHSAGGQRDLDRVTVRRLIPDVPRRPTRPTAPAETRRVVTAPAGPAEGPPVLAGQGQPPLRPGPLRVASRPVEHQMQAP
jgi:hypothetical protein